MADGVLFSSAEADLQRAVMASLRADAGVRAIFGDPPRVYDDESTGPDYPYAVLERHEASPADSQQVAGMAHTLSFAVISRFGGRLDMREFLGALRSAVEGMELVLQGQRVVLVLVIYSDVLRASDRRAYRGLLRVRIITEEVA